ncbi:aromatic amino acid exporter [Planctomycetes bacterium Poly30]|uniref:Aromatic amino acid exporter n=1 Tax=Saltatorellus ferox TaxID=2528018 RepID=A0A518EQ20_9BACT|nr:aromatic amino acid exporter [Planctomycetes bacterium Poly30]
MRTGLLTALTLIAFAGNSILCRMALLPGSDGAGAIGAPAFTALRLLSGALVLAPLLLLAGSKQALPVRETAPRSPWRSAGWPALMLATYALTFSLSYVTVPAGIGALILFGTVQILMLGVALARGERMSAAQVGGFLAAIAGIVVLVGPSAANSAASSGDRLDWAGAVLMVLAGVAWGFYTLLGRGSADPVRRTAQNFVACVPFGLALGAYALWGDDARATTRGVLLSVTSGALTSGAGYALWYAALRGHSRSSAAAVQLLVPVLAALGGMVFLGEEPGVRFAVASVLVLGGVGAAVLLPSAPRARP